MNNSATKVFRRSLKIRRAASELDDPASDAAWARKPSRGSGENTFCHPAVIVTITSQASGVSVTQAKRARPILMRIVVPTDRKSTRLNSSHSQISYAVFCLKKKNQTQCHRTL